MPLRMLSWKGFPRFGLATCFRVAAGRGPAQAAELIDHLRSVSRTLTCDPQQRTLRTDTDDAVAVAIGRSH